MKTQIDTELKGKVADMIVRVYEGAPDKSIFPCPWTLEMVNWLSGYELAKNDDGEDVGFFGWMEYQQGIFIVGGLANEHRKTATRAALDIGKKWVGFFKKHSKKELFALQVPSNEPAAAYAKILGIKIIHEMPEGLVR